MQEHTTRPARTGATARLRALLGLGVDPPLPHPATIRLEPVRRSWLAAFWQARIAVRAGISLDDFLRSRLARYQALLPVSPARLPLEVRVEDGQLVLRPLASEAPPANAGDAGAWLAPLEALDGPAVRQEVASLEVRLALLDGELDAARRRRDELERRLAADVGSGRVAAAPSVVATAEQLGRPPVRSAAPRAALGLFALAALAAEAWYVAVPLLASAGIDARALGDALAGRTAEVVFAAVFGAGVSAGLVALSSAGLSAVGELGRGASPARTRSVAISLLASALATLGVAAAIAALPTPGAHGLPALARTLLLAAVPAGAAAALRAARREEEWLTAQEAGALAWDRERARALEERARRLDEIAVAASAEGALLLEGEAARRRLRELGARAGLAARRAARAAQAERAALSRVARSLVAALELDRYEFVREASSRGAEPLLQRRRPAERPALEPAAPPASRAVAS